MPRPARATACGCGRLGPTGGFYLRTSGRNNRQAGSGALLTTSIVSTCTYDTGLRPGTLMLPDGGAGAGGVVGSPWRLKISVSPALCGPPSTAIVVANSGMTAIVSSPPP